ncbi:hypothetical protein CALVIDRAFT_535723 [Calocera viscosa TUFC12733]|uniref:Uncharacterized protein n=1 Tax=Calocera viscosa (strain TUFC12733) TaxID=1330018 RepID=A0A167NVN9_CALVF|nr:hypothetical protein CALVIDRAFT_535723 [Calocera viscosa TUFC12733]
MGKWTQLHVENVLVEKMRLMVQSVMQDIKDSEVEPPMSFDAFAEHLDPSSTFMKQLVELMVMETADTRASSRDAVSTHISRRTFNKLQALCAHYHVNERRPRRFSTRQSEMIPPIDTDRIPRIPDLTTDGWTDVADELEQDEEMLDMSMGQFPLATGRYDVMVPNGVDPETGISRLRPATPPWEDVFPAPPRASEPPSSTSPPFDARPFLRLRSEAAAASYSGPSLSRQNPPRRPVRQRMVDFNDWTGRARATARRGQDTRPRAASGDGIEEGPAVVPSIPSYQIGTFADTYRDAPSDSEDADAYSRAHRPVRQPSTSQDLLTSASAVRRNYISSRLRRGGIPPPENLLNNPFSSYSRGNSHLTVGSAVTAPRSMLDGSPMTFNRSPSPLLSLFEGTERTVRTVGLQATETGGRGHVAARTEPTHLATPRSSTPGSVEAVEGESTNASGPTGAAELA